ncbi:TraR/DksA C4-type zinc finger protein [Litorilinea aerophila]|uniref:Zinc finger DksA/TraR C4-type domain-containing protein n=1 Tax=Litorilinea aerophila TaxID=1204385 RepID=A0A540VDD3_9CHLR|nr:TraR/DksA C4-type zinc finger protein [Litorilinea aerophila]MCC9077479.1 TraR/DksA C4-type zinc finger protein [Litorilinea aerophila]
MTSQLDLNEIRRQLEEERERLLEKVRVRNGNDSTGAGRNPNRTDLASDYLARERRTALLSMEQKMLAQIDEALQRLEDGTYGRCESCGEPIPPERLEALPYATLCVICQERSSSSS